MAHRSLWKGWTVRCSRCTGPLLRDGYYFNCMDCGRDVDKVASLPRTLCGWKVKFPRLVWLVGVRHYRQQRSLAAIAATFGTHKATIGN